MVGGYDKVEQPLVVDERFDYVLFTDVVKTERMGVWQVRAVPYFHEDFTRYSRYPKMHPEELFSEYAASLYIDANLQIVSRDLYDQCVAFYEQGVDWGGVKHPNPPYADCIYDHAFVVLACGLDTERTVFRWCHRLRKEGYPQNNGLYENNVIFRINNEACRQVDESWWQLYCDYSRRDQLSLFYVFWKHPSLRHELLLPEDERAVNSKWLKLSLHGNVAPKTRTVKQGFLEHARTRLRSAANIEKRLKWNKFHYRLYGLPLPIAFAILNLWSLFAVVVYGPRIKYEAYKRHVNEKKQ